ncbi:rhomboid family intramembrane serine protease [Actinomadura sp. DC4]|uniref:rhomboid family intramembrane serine protease n=1 Tax=Actinomadura sp. DC4 TaxID=3055069 RepID=UPI0025B1306A|nr:rhomboid family intramembrane serine protease [Actinomadura sp. DC4]MDN3356713.1 rhomboid family intramembrane serine protease [Actinomadura sp. DC4]
MTLRRFPFVTAAVFGVTLTANLLLFAVHGLLGRMERSPAGLHGDWWRTVTALSGQDGGVAGTVSNLAFLVVIGAIAEQLTSRPRWLLCYFGTGLVGEFAGYGWQPYGAGNSVAICGLAGVVAVALWSDAKRVPSLGPGVLLVWCGALLAYFWSPLVVLGVVAGLLTRGRAPRWTAAAALATGVTLTAAENLHGAALLAGLTLATLLTRPARAGVHGAVPSGSATGHDRSLRRLTSFAVLPGIEDDQRPAGERPARLTSPGWVPGVRRRRPPADSV